MWRMGGEGRRGWCFDCRFLFFWVTVWTEFLNNVSCVLNLWFWMWFLLYLMRIHVCVCLFVTRLKKVLFPSFPGILYNNHPFASPCSRNQLQRNSSANSTLFTSTILVCKLQYLRAVKCRIKENFVHPVATMTSRKGEKMWRNAGASKRTDRG